MNVDYNFPTVRVRLILDPLFGLFFDKGPYRTAPYKIKYNDKKFRLIIIISNILRYRKLIL